MPTKQITVAVGVVLGSLALAACDIDVPDLNNPGLDQLENTPTATGINTACTGLLIGMRAGKSGTTGLVNQLGILGRESYTFDSADGRFVQEELEQDLQKNSAFGGVFWQTEYSYVRLANIILHGVDKVPEFATTDGALFKAGIQGFVHTVQAFELLTVVVTHDTAGAVVDTDRPLGEALGDIVSKDAVYTEIARLLDAGATELAGGGATFSFALSPGFTGFSTPKDFIKFNRALRARVAVYQKPKDYAAALTALTASFINDTAEAINFNTGVYYSFSLASGDVTNGLISPSIYAHPLLETDAAKQLDPTKLDARFTSKTEVMDEAIAYGDPVLMTNLAFTLYPSNTTPLVVIRNEELILIKAEAQWFTGDKPNALATLNKVRVQSGKLQALPTIPATDDAFVDALLYERRYSLMFEGGHRWIDLRRFGRTLPIDRPNDKRNVRFPIPQGECDARGNPTQCSITSSMVIAD